MNKCIFMGNIVRDLEIRFAAGSGTAVVKFPLALQRMKKDDGADFINCIAFGKTAETMALYLKKGSKVLIEARVQTGSYDSKEGHKVYTTDFVIERFEFAGSAEGGGATQNRQNVNPVSTYSDDMTPVDEGDIPF